MAYERKYILEKLKEASEILGRSPTEEDLSRLGFPSRKAYRNKFGTFEAAKELLGLKRKPKGGRKDAPKKIRFEILHRDGFRCQYCGTTPQLGAVLQVDHIIPVANGGANTWSNLITSCRDCNIGKRTMTLTSKP